MARSAVISSSESSSSIKALGFLPFTATTCLEPLPITFFFLAALAVLPFVAVFFDLTDFIFWTSSPQEYPAVTTIVIKKHIIKTITLNKKLTASSAARQVYSMHPGGLCWSNRALAILFSAGLPQCRIMKAGAKLLSIQPYCLWQSLELPPRHTLLFPDFEVFPLLYR